VSTKVSPDSPIIAVVGPTASGKSSLAVEIAVRANVEVINCDSVQVYSETEIATAKIPLAERRGVTHHLLDFVPPGTTYTAGQWGIDALRVIREIEARGRTAVIAGGTGLYLRALRKPFFNSPPTDEALRRRLEQIRESRGNEHLFRLLRRLDPESAKEINIRDWPRVHRALEVRIQTGERISEVRPRRQEAPSEASRIVIVALNPPRAALYERINRRAQEHFDAGLVDEVRMLLHRGIPRRSNALGAHGYRRVVEYLEGTRTLESAIEQTKQDVRNYAKRQMSWFRHEEGVNWFDGFGDDPDVRDRILEFLGLDVKAE
jgi:tRNA dimethylallyltransferase